MKIFYNNYNYIKTYRVGKKLITDELGGNIVFIWNVDLLQLHDAPFSMNETKLGAFTFSLGSN